jgi:hypothetical protein
MFKRCQGHSAIKCSTLLKEPEKPRGQPRCGWHARSEDVHDCISALHLRSGRGFGASAQHVAGTPQFSLTHPAIIGWRVGAGGAPALGLLAPRLSEAGEGAAVRTESRLPASIHTADTSGKKSPESALLERCRQYLQSIGNCGQYARQKQRASARIREWHS